VFPPAQIFFRGVSDLAARFRIATGEGRLRRNDWVAALFYGTKGKGGWRDPLVGRDLLIRVSGSLLMNVISSIPTSPSSWIGATLAAGLLGFGLFLVARRYGLLALYVFGLCDLASHLSAHFSAWYAGSTFFFLAALLALALYAFYTSLGGQKVFSGKLLEE
jgi:hypothetical protein